MQWGNVGHSNVIETRPLTRLQTCLGVALNMLALFPLWGWTF